MYQFYWKQDVMETSEAMYIPYNQRSKQKLMIDSIAIKLEDFQEQ